MENDKINDTNQISFSFSYKEDGETFQTIIERILINEIYKNN